MEPAWVRVRILARLTDVVRHDQLYLESIGTEA